MSNPQYWGERFVCTYYTGEIQIFLWPDPDDSRMQTRSQQPLETEFCSGLTCESTLIWTYPLFKFLNSDCLQCPGYLLHFQLTSMMNTLSFPELENSVCHAERDIECLCTMEIWVITSAELTSTSYFRVIV